MMHEGWLTKRKLASTVSSPQIDQLYEAGVRAGALGGKPAGSAKFASMATSQDLLRDAALLGVAKRFKLGAPLEEYPTSIKLDLAHSTDKTLSSVDPQAVSIGLGIPLARVQAGLERLRAEPVPAAPDKKKSEPDIAATVEQAIVQYALRDVGPESDQPRGVQDNATASSPPTAASPEDRMTIEEAVQRLRGEADRLMQAPEIPASAASSDKAQEFSSRLRKVSDTLLGYADLVSITDRRGHLLYGNGAFAMLAARAAESGTDADLNSWGKAIAAQPPGRSRLTSLTADPDADRWDLQRTAIQGAKGNAPEAYFNILRADTGPKPIPDALTHIDPLLHELALHTSFVAYGSPDRRAKSITELEGLVEKLEEAVGLAAATGGSTQP